MLALIRKADGKLEQYVESTVGYDLALYDVVAAPAQAAAHDWDAAGRAFVPRPPSEAEVTRDAIESDPRWQALKRASPAQIDAWLTSNVQSLADARRVLRVLLLTVQHLARTRV